MFRRLVVTVSLAVPSLLMAGCGTFVNHQEPGSYFNYKGTATPYLPYGGVVVDLKLAVMNAEAVVDDKEDDPYSAAAVAAGFLLFDLPLSIAADTILLPIDVINTLRGRGKPPEGGWPLLHLPAPDQDAHSLESKPDPPD